MVRRLPRVGLERGQKRRPCIVGLSDVVEQLGVDSGRLHATERAVGGVELRHRPLGQVAGPFVEGGVGGAGGSGEQLASRGRVAGEVDAAQAEIDDLAIGAEKVRTVCSAQQARDDSRKELVGTGAFSSSLEGIEVVAGNDPGEFRLVP